MFFTILYFVLAILGLGFLIFIHELGHYLVGKKVGMKIETFSIGMGKGIFSWNRNGVKWQVGWLPFGGFVKFAGMDKEGGKEPYEIKNGYFGKGPFSRIKVALAGPLTNIVFAFLAFVLLYFCGGIQKPFSEITKHIGYVDKKSDLYKRGVRPGDEITKLNTKPYSGVKDLLYTGLENISKVDVQGNKIDYYSHSKSPFNVNASTYSDPAIKQGLLTMGVSPIPTYLARYIVFDKMAPNSPMQGSSIKENDRIFWVNGEFIFSNEQQSEIINRANAFLTIQRGNSVVHSIVPRIKFEDVKLSYYDKQEIDDWRYFAKIKQKLSDLYFIPYYINQDAVVENNLTFFDEDQLKGINEENIRNKYFNPLHRGDKILAINGVKIKSSIDLLKSIQNSTSLIIVQRKEMPKKLISWKEADIAFNNSINIDSLDRLVSYIGTDKQIGNIKDLYVLNPIVPKSASQIFPDLQSQDEQIKDKLFLGIGIKDTKVNFNPNPFVMFSSVIAETYKSISILAKTMKFKFVSSPIGIVTIVQQHWALGWKQALFWLAFISFNLGIINLLPIPVLDGGHVAMAVYEMVTKKPLTAKTMERITLPFMILLIAFMIYVTYNDLSRIFTKFMK
jgi:regulator of sigma E protease